MTETLFGAEVPAGSNNDNTPYTLGTRFTPVVIGNVTHVVYPVPATLPTGDITVGVYRNSDLALLKSTTVSPAGFTPETKVPIALSGGQALVAGVAYTAFYYTPNWYVSTNAYAWPKNNGANLVSANPGGWYNGNFTVDFPNDNFGGANYFADLVFEPSGVDPAEGSAALSLGLAVAATGSTDAEGSAALGLGLALAAAGATDAEGVAALGLGFAVAAAGARRAQGEVALDLGLNLASAGARDSLGSATLGLDLAVSSSGVRAAAGTSALSLNLALAAQGSDGQAGRPVTPWPYGEREVSGYPWTPRPVKSFTGEVG